MLTITDSLSACSSAASDGKAADGAAPGDAAAAAAAEKRRPAAFLAVGASHTYDGRHSEGNRFIIDRDL
jgi:hypothetical protein